MPSPAKIQEEMVTVKRTEIEELINTIESLEQKILTLTEMNKNLVEKASANIH